MSFKTENWVLYQPDSIIEERVSGIALAEYAKQQASICENFFEKQAIPENLDIVYIILPGKRAKVWFVSSRRENVELRSLAGLLENVAPPEVTTGPIAIALCGSIAGASREFQKEESYQPPILKEWRDAMAKLERPAIVPEGILDLVWPDHTSVTSPTPQLF